MIRLYQKVTPLKVLRHFFDNPDEEFYLRELARILDISPMTVKRALTLLLEDNLLVREERKNQIMYRAKIENVSFRYAKISYNLARIENAGLVTSLLDRVPGISSVVLYGSFAAGENDTHSDLDLLVISTAKTLRDGEIGRKLGVEVNIMNFTGTQWFSQAKTNRAFYLDVITEGIVLYGERPVME